MDVRILRYFLAVAREENITRAAESLHIAQPSLSKQLMELEQELGKKLFIRGKRKLTLTEDGVLLRKRADEIVDLLEKTEREIRSDTENISGEISIGGAPTKTVLHTAAVLRAEHTNIQFNFYSSDATEVTERLDHGSLDFAVLLEPVDTMKYECIHLPDSSYWGILMPSDCALAEKAVVSKEDFCKLPLILHRRAGLQREMALWAQTELEHINIVATYNVANGSPDSFVTSKLGYLLMIKRHLSGELDPSVCFRPLDPPLELHYSLVWKRYQVFSKAAEAFLNKIKSNI